MAKSTQVANVTEFNLLTQYDGMDEEEVKELEDELDDLDDVSGVNYRRIKMPSGSGRAFEVESDDPDDADMVKTIEGVILLTHPLNVRWEKSMTDGSGGEPPVCSSFDGKYGADLNTGEMIECRHCKYNEFEDGAGKECKNKRRIYMILNGNPWLYVFDVPPTSANAVGKQLKTISTRTKTPFTKMVVQLSLEKDTTRTGKDFSKVIVKRLGCLSNEQWEVTKKMRLELRDQYMNVGIESTAEDVAGSTQTAPRPDADGFINIPEGDDGSVDVPFS